MSARLQRLPIFRWAKAIFSYLALSWVLRLLAESLTSYGLIRADFTFEEIGEILEQTKISVISIVGSISYFVLRRTRLKADFPPLPNIMAWIRIRNIHSLAALRGALAPMLWISVMLFLGRYEFIGWFLDAARTPATILMPIVRILFFIPWLWCEEIIFRTLTRNALEPRLGIYPPIFIGAILTALFRSTQFTLSLSQLLNTFFIALYLGWLTSTRKEAITGFALWLPFLVSMNCILGLPVFGSDVAGIVQFQYQSPNEVSSFWSRSFSGGSAGPMGSFSLTLLVLFAWIWDWLENQKRVLKIRDA